MCMHNGQANITNTLYYTKPPKQNIVPLIETMFCSAYNKNKVQTISAQLGLIYYLLTWYCTRNYIGVTQDEFLW